jgi:phosphate-selective porin
VEVSSEALVDRWERAGRGPATDATWVNWSTFVDAGVLVTGEDQGSGDVVPRRPVVGGPGPGAWEIAGRYEIVRVDADAFAQRAARGTSRIQSVTSTVVWSLAAGVRLLASYAYAFASDEAPLGKVRSVAPRSDEHMVTVRFDVHF